MATLPWIQEIGPTIILAIWSPYHNRNYLAQPARKRPKRGKGEKKRR
jgi:hypothetical protein